MEEQDKNYIANIIRKFGKFKDIFNKIILETD